MSDLLNAVSTALNTPESLVQRSAAARAAANGTTIDDVLAAWSGGAPLPAAAAQPAAPASSAETSPAGPPPSEPPVATIAPPVVPQIISEPDVAQVDAEPDLEPIALRRRIRTASRVGAWTGGVLGLMGFLVASTRWAGLSTVTGEGPYTPVIQANSSSIIVGVALVSIVFGAVVAGFSRAAASWVDPAMRLSGSSRATAWLGGFLGLVLGILAGAFLTSAFGTPVEGVEGLIQMPVLATIGVVIIGGAILGAGTAAVTQAIGVPVAASESAEEIKAVKARLTGALGVPLTGLALLLLIVLPFAWTLLESNHLASGGAAIIGILTAAGILTFASLSGSRPNIKLSFGEVMVAIVGIGVVLMVILAVLLARTPA